MTSKENMIQELKRQVLPLLKTNGFKGSFPHFRRIKNEKLNLITFQFDKWGGGFCIEIANGDPTGFKHYSNKFIEASKMRPYHLLHRIRLGAVDENSNHWYRYDDNNYERTAMEVIKNIQIAEKWFHENPYSA